MSITLETSVRSSKEPITMGALMTLTGECSMQGNAFREGIEMAEREIDESGGYKDDLRKEFSAALRFS